MMSRLFRLVTIVTVLAASSIEWAQTYTSIRLVGQGQRTRSAIQSHTHEERAADPDIPILKEAKTEYAKLQ